MKDFFEEFDKFRDKLEVGENFAFSRFSDGECFILQNKKLVLGSNFYITGDKAGSNIYGPEEQKSFDPDADQFYRGLLYDSYKYKQCNYFKGVPSLQDMAHINFEYDKEQDDLTFANLFINANYKRFIEEIVLKIFPNRDIIYVVNERADLRGLPFKVKKDFRIGSDCMKKNSNIHFDIFEYIIRENIRNSIVLCSAASLSNIIIHKCYSTFPDNTYLDIGSTLNPYLGEDMKTCMHTRDYLRSYWMGEKNFYGNQVDKW